MVSKQALGLFVVFTVVALVNCQFFSSNDGINLPRNGKRSYTSMLLRRKPIKDNSFRTGDDFKLLDKLSYSKSLGRKYGKRADQDDDYANEDFDDSDFDREIEELVAKYLALKERERAGSK
jgi:hypothetical protein